MPNDIISWDGILITNDRMPAHQSLSNTHDINMEPPLPICMMYVMYDVWCVEKSIDIHEKLIVLLTNQSVSDISIAKIVCSDDLSSMNPNTVIPALLFSKYVTEKKKKSIFKSKYVAIMCKEMNLFCCYGKKKYIINLQVSHYILLSQVKECCYSYNLATNIYLHNIQF